MVFGYSTNAFVRYSLEESIQKIARLGFKGVEIMGDRPHLYPPDYSEEKLNQLKILLEQNQLKVNNINSFTLFAVGDTYLPSWIEPETERREIRIRHTLQSLQVAKTLECKNISVPPGGPLEKNMTRKQAFDLFHKGLERVIPAAESLGIKILVEPEPGLLMEKTSEFKEFNHLIPGLGAIELKEVLSTMARLAYQGDISLELYPYTDMPEEAGRKSLEFLHPIFTEIGYHMEGWGE